MLALTRSKRGQTEDIFSDLIPALIIFIIAIVVVSQIKGEHDNKINKILEKPIPIVDRMKPLVLLKSPFDLGKKAGYSDMDFMDFMDNLRKIKKTDTAKIQKLKDAKIAEIIDIDYGAEQGSPEPTRIYGFKCNEEMFRFIDDNFRVIKGGSMTNYPFWIVRVFVSSDIPKLSSKVPGVLFICTSNMYKYKDNKIEKKTQGCYTSDYETIKDLFFWGGSLGQKYSTKGVSSGSLEETFTVEFEAPTEDPKLDYIIVVDYSLADECPAPTRA